MPNPYFQLSNNNNNNNNDYIKWTAHTSEYYLRIANVRLNLRKVKSSSVTVNMREWGSWMLVNSRWFSLETPATVNSGEFMGRIHLFWWFCSGSGSDTYSLSYVDPQSSILDPAHTCGVPERGRCSKKGRGRRRGGVPMSTLTRWFYCHGNGTTASLLSRAPPSLL